MAPTSTATEPPAGWMQALLEHPNLILFSLDPRGRITWISPQVERILGLRPASLLGQKAIAGLTASHQPLAEAHREAKQDGREEKATYETVVQAGDRQVWLEVTSHAQRDGAGQLLAVHGLAVDVTDRHQARQALERSRQRMSDVLDDANDVVYLHNLEGQFIAVNAAGVSTYGYSRDEFLRLSIRDIVDPAHLGRAAEEMRLKVEGKKRTSAAYELLTRAKDGRGVWVEVSTRVVLNGDRPVAIQGIARDITRRKADEAALRLVQRIALATADAPDFDSALGLALEGLVDATGCARAEAWAPGADARLHLLAAWPEERSPQVEKFHRLSRKADFGLGDGLAGRAWREGRAVWLSDLAHDPTFLRAASATAAGFRSLLAVPILADGNLVALLILFLKDAGREPHWTPLVESVAAQLGAVLRRRRVEDQLGWQQGLLASQWAQAPLAVLLVGPSGDVLGANRAFLGLCGVELPAGPPRIGAAFLSSLPDPDGFVRRATRIYEMRGADADHVELEGKVLHRTVADLSGPEGQPLGKAVYLRDVTEERAAAARLSALRSRTRLPP